MAKQVHSKRSNACNKNRLNDDKKMQFSTL